MMLNNYIVCAKMVNGENIYFYHTGNSYNFDITNKGFADAYLNRTEVITDKEISIHVSSIVYYRRVDNVAEIYNIIDAINKSDNTCNKVDIITKVIDSSWCDGETLENKERALLNYMRRSRVSIVR
jgi:hypothetical protein